SVAVANAYAPELKTALAATAVNNRQQQIATLTKMTNDLAATIKSLEGALAGKPGPQKDIATAQRNALQAQYQASYAQLQQLQLSSPAQTRYTVVPAVAQQVGKQSTVL